MKLISLKQQTQKPGVLPPGKPQINHHWWWCHEVAVKDNKTLQPTRQLQNSSGLYQQKWVEYWVSGHWLSGLQTTWMFASWDNIHTHMYHSVWKSHLCISLPIPIERDSSGKQTHIKRRTPTILCRSEWYTRGNTAIAADVQFQKFRMCNPPMFRGNLLLQFKSFQIQSRHALPMRQTVWNGETNNAHSSWRRTGTHLAAVNSFPGHLSWLMWVCRLKMPQMFNGIGVKVSLARKPQMDRSDRSHMLHGAVIFTNICPKNHPVM